MAGQSVEILGSLKVNDVETDSFESTLLVLQPDGIISKRQAEAMIIRVLIANGTINIQNLFNAGYTVQMLMEAGVTKSQLYGKTYQGGLIFYIDSTNYTGLVSSSANQGQVQWGCSGIETEATGLTIGTGSANTDLIVANCAIQDIAADLCFDLSLNGFTDWFLPSRDELQVMYSNLHLLMFGNFTSGRYWSSSEDSGDNAWDLNFIGGSSLLSNKGISRHVRAIRAF